MIWAQIGILVIQLIIAIVSYLKAYRNRSIYSLKTAVLRMPSGTTLDGADILDTSYINEALKEGNYTVLNVAQRIDGDLEILMGRIKREKQSKQQTK